MAEMSNEFRAKFPREGMQRRWFEAVRQDLTVGEIARLCSCSERTIRDWQREKFLPDYACLKKICTGYSIPFPKVKRVYRYAHIKEAGRKGWEKVSEKYGRIPTNESLRMKMWERWWEETGKKRRQFITIPKEIHRPRKSKKLAEFIGIMIGDGTVSNYHIAVTLHLSDDKEYGVYVKRLMEELFYVQPKIYIRNNQNTFSVAVARKLLADYLHSLGLPIGDKVKQGVAVPEWIMKNEGYMRACMCGLMDTDGSVFKHRYSSKGKKYSYTKLSFTSASPPLRQDAADILAHFGIRACSSGSNVRIDSRKAVERYMNVIGSHNPKYLKRMKE